VSPNLITAIARANVSFNRSVFWFYSNLDVARKLYSPPSNLGFDPSMLIYEDPP